MTGNVVLCGFMGCGKTCVGKRTARLMHRQFCNLDSYIEKREGMTINEIFAKYGEEEFRRREAQAVLEVSEKGNMVIACGGGTVLFPENVEAFRKNGSVILFLDVPLAILQDRLKYDKERPLLQKPNRQQVIADLYKKRLPLYRAAADKAVRSTAPPWIIAKRIAALSTQLLEFPAGQSEKT